MVTDRLLSGQEQKALWNIPEKGYIKRLLAAQLAKADKEWVEWIESNFGEIIDEYHTEMWYQRKKEIGL